MKPSISIAGIIFLFLTLMTASAQVATGTLPFQSYGGGPFDTVNLGNLNVHFAIPIINKPGRGGTPFFYSLAYDSSVWYPVTSNGVISWKNIAGFGWTGTSPLMGGSITTTTHPNWRCQNPPSGYYYVTATMITSYIDPSGTSHPFLIPEDPCDTEGTFQGTTRDGSGWTVAYSQGGVNATSRNGNVLTVGPVLGTSVIYSDTNANQITQNANQQFFDTLSATTPVFTVAGGLTPSNPTTFTYTAPSGGNAVYTVNYTQYTVATNFGVSGVKEYGPYSVALVSSIGLPDGTSYQFTYEPTPGSSCTPLSGTTSCTTARMASVTLPTLGSIAYAYTGGSNGIESDGSAACLIRTLAPGGAWQYSRTQVSGTHWQTQITSPPDPVNTGSANDVTLIDFQEDSDTTTPTQLFFETQRVINQGSSNTLLTVLRCYNANYAACTTTAVTSGIGQMDVYTTLPNGSTRASEIVYNGYGLVTSDTEYGYGVTSGAAPASAQRLRLIAASYAQLSNGINDHPGSYSIKDYDASGRGSQRVWNFGYDETAVTQTSGTPQHGTPPTGARGNLTSIYYQVNGLWNALSRTYTYYDTGMPLVATDMNGATTTYNYGTGSCGNSFPTSVSEPLSLAASLVWNCTGGVPTQITDENGNNVKANYSDADFWRPASVVDQLNNQTNYTYGGQTAVETSLQGFNGGSSAFDFRATVDGFLRPILSQRLQAPGSTNYDTTEMDYDTFGRPSRSTMPFVAAAGSTSSTTPGVNKTYDALNRPLTVTDASGGTVTYRYVNNDVLQVTSGTQSFQKQFEYDGIGTLASVCEITAATGSGSCGQSNTQTGFLTTYVHSTNVNNVNIEMFTVTQNAQPGAIGGSQTRTYQYDQVSRLISETNPETNNLSYSYVYDTDTTCGTSSGDLVKRVDAVGNVTCYAYDKLHRVTAITYPSGTYATATPTKCFVYDAATVNSVAMTNVKTRLAEAYTTASTCSGTKLTDIGYSYSARGELTDSYESTPHSSGYYHTTNSYWAHGLINQLSSNISGLPTISYGGSGGTSGLDGEGRLLQVTASSGQSPVTGVTYTTSGTIEPIGSLTKVTLGSVDSDSFQYDVNTGRPKQYQFNIGTTQSVSGILGWNSNGTLASLNITDQLNTANSQICAYAYDDLVRLASANCGSSIWSQTFNYDAFGNITKNVPTGSTGGSFQSVYNTSTNQLSSVSNATPTYDSNGNLTYDTLHNLTWDSDGNMLTVDSTAVQVTYDAFDRAVEQNRGGAYTEIVYSPSGAKLALMNSTTLVKAFVPLPGGPMAVYAAGTTGPLYYRHADWLGSSRVASTQSRTKYFDVSYAPFGENYNNSGTTDYNFTGQNQDTEAGYTGYDDFRFREYSPGQGRWLSPDPAGIGAVNPVNPQSWNRYAYVRNNPTAFVDPLGLADCELDGGDQYVCTYSDDFVNGSKGGGAGGGWFGQIYEFLPQEIESYVWVPDGSGGPDGPNPPDSGGGGGGGSCSVGASSSVGDSLTALGGFQPMGQDASKNGQNSCKPSLTPRQQCLANAQSTFNQTMDQINSRSIWSSVIFGASFGTLTGAAWGCFNSPFAYAMCQETWGGSALVTAVNGGISGGAGGATKWMLTQTGDTLAAQNAFTQQVNNVCSKLPN